MESCSELEFYIVPNINRPLIITAGAPNYPNLNAGIFVIGNNQNNGAFIYRSLWLQVGAIVITRINNFVENYGTILIDGTL